MKRVIRPATIRRVMAWEPCYSLARVTRLFAGRSALNVEQVAALRIPAMDRLRALDRMLNTRQRLAVLTRFYGSREMAEIRCRDSSCPVYSYGSSYNGYNEYSYMPWRFSYSTALDRRMLRIVRAYARGE